MTPLPFVRPVWNRPAPLIDGAAQRRHGSHAWCGRLCVPVSLHDDLVNRHGAQDADAQLKAWYPAVLARYAGQPIGDDVFDFWRHEFAAWVGTVTRKPAPAVQDKTSHVLAAARELITRQVQQQLDQQKAIKE